ncbi:MAG: xanthine dehydrogenase family protein molybdopterin-binding subunit, partial [Beijerinckiaceae bacterium]
MTMHPGTMKKFGLGQPVRRLEDERFITGAGRYTDDIHVEGAAHAVILRSPHACASFTITDMKAAKAIKGVLGIFTAADMKGLKGVACQAPMQTADGKKMPLPEWPLLCKGEVMHIGDAVAMVVAESAQIARDAAEAIVVDYVSRPVTTTIADAIRPGAPQVWPDAPGNIAYDQTLGNADKTNAAFAKAARVVTLTVENNRLVTNYM